MFTFALNVSDTINRILIRIFKGALITLRIFEDHAMHHSHEYLGNNFVIMIHYINFKKQTNEEYCIQMITLRLAEAPISLNSKMKRSRAS